CCWCRQGPPYDHAPVPGEGARRQPGRAGQRGGHRRRAPRRGQGEEGPGEGQEVNTTRPAVGCPRPPAALPWTRAWYGERIMTLDPAIAGRAALYARGATDKQADSIPGQLERLRALAAARGLPVAAEYTDGGGAGVGTKARPGLRRLLADGREGR